jgi:PAS domain-containing protein
MDMQQPAEGVYETRGAAYRSTEANAICLARKTATREIDLLAELRYNNPAPNFEHHTNPRRRDAIAGRWYKPLARTSSFVPLRAALVRQHLVELTEQAIALLLTEPFEYGKAQAIGAAPARLRYVQPEALGRTQELLACQLVQGLPADQVVALQLRLAALPAALATGFFQQAREMIMAEQEQIYRALIAELQRIGESLRESEQMDTCAFDLFSPDVAEHRKAQCGKVVRSGRPVRFEDEREGRWFNSSVYPVLDAQGKVGKLAVLARDITVRWNNPIPDCTLRPICQAFPTQTVKLSLQTGGTIYGKMCYTHRTITHGAEGTGRRSIPCSLIIPLAGHSVRPSQGLKWNVAPWPKAEGGEASARFPV